MDNIHSKEPEQTVPPAKELFQSPFGVEAVDPLVFNTNPTGIAPELRASAFNIPDRGKDRVEVLPPKKLSRRKYGEWVPGGREAKVPKENELEVMRKRTLWANMVRRTLAILAILIPFSIIIYFIHLIIGLYH